MLALAEGQVAFGVATVQVEPVGLGERGFVPARGGQPQVRLAPWGGELSLGAWSASRAWSLLR